MAGASRWGTTPRESVRSECRRRGEAAVVAGCVDLLHGREVDPELLVSLGGPPARWALTGEEGGPAYWTRVWALRGLLHAWDASAAAAVVDALDDGSWRVREAALRVVARRELDEALERVAGLRADPVARVRAGADRALRRLARAGA